MPKNRTLKTVIILTVLFFLKSGLVIASDDGFGSAKKIEGEYFNIYYSTSIQPSILIQNLNVGPLDNLMVGKPAQKKTSAEEELVDMLDTLFMRVSDILDMHLYSFQGTIKICADEKQLKQIYWGLFDRDLTAPSFYVSDSNTIYIAIENFKREIIGHEIAHAIISRYFVVEPPVKIHEILGMYVEYQLRRTSQ
jgi:hypothetical protein